MLTGLSAKTLTFSIEILCKYRYISRTFSFFTSFDLSLRDPRKSLLKYFACMFWSKSSSTDWPSMVPKSWGDSLEYLFRLLFDAAILWIVAMVLLSVGYVICTPSGTKNPLSEKKEARKQMRKASTSDKATRKKGPPEPIELMGHKRDKQVRPVGAEKGCQGPYRTKRDVITITCRSVRRRG